jgi:protein-disulfide isomerase
MKVANASDREFLSPRALYVLLAVSIATNIIMIARFSYSNAIENLFMRMQAPPVATSSDHVRGNANAKGTVIIYMDFQCPYCARLHAEMLALYKGTDTRWIYRHFPLESHPYAEKAAEAAECSGAQGKFWEYSDELFDPNFKIDSDSSFSHLASAVGLDSKVFEACLSSGQFASRVAAQREDGIRRRIAGTPTFFVNGKRFDGVIPLDQLRQALMR